MAATADSTLTIGVLLPDALGTYSDSGNAVVLAQRARWRGIAARVLQFTADVAPSAACDIYVLGGGEDTAQVTATAWLRRQPALVEAMASRALTLAVCAGFQILGRTMSDRSGHTYSGLGLIDVTTGPAARRAIGEVVTRCAIPGVGLLTGFENHLGVSTVGGGHRVLGRVVHGTGNGTADGDGHIGDGVWTDRIVATYLHGPVLARNPALADHLLGTATGLTLEPLDLPDQPALRRTYLERSAR